MVFPFSLMANTEGHEHESGVVKQDPSTVVVDHIMTHIADANEYHILTIGEKHISIPLPYFLYNKNSGKVSIGLSSAFHHEEIVDGYILDHHTGRIVDATTRDRSTFIDLSITKNVFHMILGFIILTLVLVSAKRGYENRKGKAPKGIQSALEPIINYLVEDVIKENIGSKYEKFVPFLLSIFFFILINNLLGLIPFFPGGANASGNIAFTLVLAVLAFIMININGTKSYWGHIFAMPGVPKWVLLILTPVEIVGLFIKPIALMLRLFGNITGGHIAILSIVGLIFIFGELGSSMGGTGIGAGIAIPIVLFVNAMELFVAFLQAYVFTLLTAIFIGAALEEHQHSEEHH